MDDLLLKRADTVIADTQAMRAEMRNRLLQARIEVARIRSNVLLARLEITRCHHLRWGMVDPVD